MRNYISIVRDIERNLMPSDTNFSWYSKRTEAELRRILEDLKDLLLYKPELDESHQEVLQRLYEFLKKNYKSYRHHKPPKDLNPKELDNYL
jgi:hypothetical protein|tara:strand:+ start:213 stop:485 length:273 start_codon:yes stop_codon:yes gene_type:complete